MDTPDKVSGLVTSSSPNRSSVSSSYTAPLLATYRSPQNAPSTVMDQDSHSTEDRTNRATSVLSMDDLEAAQALEGLRSDFGHSPRASRQTLPAVSPDPSPSEPLLSLLTSSHPLISSAINGSVSAYTTSKSYSARFKSSAEFIERNIGSPVANTVGTVGRKTGVESGLRWALQRRDSTNETDHNSKRRKVSGEVMSPSMDVEQGPDMATLSRTRSSSDLSMTETLPPYDDMSSPRYEEKPARQQQQQQQTSPTWQSRLVISTSGLGVAMSEESLRSLQYCLTWLRWANGRLGKAILALQSTLTEWENHRARMRQRGDMENGDRMDSDAPLLTQRIHAVKQDVLSTLKQVVDVVSKYAGGALPENARFLVRRHLTSLPHRFQMASTSQPPLDSPAAASEATVGAHRILVLANEGLDILGQVSGVVNDTLVSAEHWCERLGKKRPENRTAPDAEKKDLPALYAQQYDMDIKQPLVSTETIKQDDVPMSGTDQA